MVVSRDRSVLAAVIACVLVAAGTARLPGAQIRWADGARMAVIAGPGLAAGNAGVPFGNFIAKAAVRQLNHEHPGLDAIWVQPLAAASRDLGRIFESVADDVQRGRGRDLTHARAVPGCGGSGCCHDRVPHATRDMLDLVPLAALAPREVSGRPSLATRAKGEAALSAAT